MSALNWLLDRLRRYSRRTDDNPDNDDEYDRRFDIGDARGVRTVVHDGYRSEPRISVNIYTSEVLYDRTGRDPEVMAALHLGKKLEEHGLSYRISYNYSPYDAVEEVSGVPNDTIRPFLDDLRNRRVDRAKNANLLLVDSEGGGASLHGASTCPAHFLDERRPEQDVGDDKFCHNIHDILHEFAHCMGVGHDEDDELAGNNHPGTAYNDDEAEQWVRTPTVAGNDVMNACGEYIPKREYRDARYDLRFTKCDLEHFRYDIEERT